jgi:hypothetical protein
MPVRSTTSEYQPSPPCGRLGGKAAYARTVGTGEGAVVTSASSDGLSKSNKSGKPPLASGNQAGSGGQSRGPQS